MANFKRLFGVIIVISLLLSTSVLFITQLATTGNGEGEPEESTLYEASKSWDGTEPDIDVDQDHLDFECSIAGSTPSTAVTSNKLDFECTTATLSSYEAPPSNDKIEMMLLDSPPTPPVDVSHTIVNADHLSASALILSDVPTSEWTDGCTATSAGMLFGYYDRTGYPNMYTGPTNGGVCPLTDLGQGDPTNPRYPIPGSCYIISTENGLDGISSNAHVDDYWISYGSAGPDPWEGNWPEHTWELCTADFLGTNQWKWDYSSYPGTDGSIDSNGDGSTTIWTYNDGSKLYDWCPGPAYGTPTTSCCHGIRLFAESRGYSVEANYNQLTDNQNPNGFTFAEFQAEIDAGRPVLIHVIGHTMVGIGYDTATNSIYIHDTWDNNVRSMTWGGSYADMDLYAVTVIHLAPPNEYSLIISSTSGGSVTTPGEGTFNYDEGTVVDLIAEADTCYEFVNWTGDVDTIADVYAASTNITMDDDYEITANFIAQYDLTIDSMVGGNVTTPGEGLFPDYDAGTVVDLVATPDAGYRFVNWTGDVGTIADVNAAATNITMDGDYEITANFIAQYDLTIDSTVGGNVTTPGEGLFPDYDAGAVVDLVATPDEGYRFDEWTGDVGTIADVYDASTTITMNDDYSITAEFVKQYDLTISSTEGGSVITPGEGVHTYDGGEVVDLVATPDAGYRFDEWTGDVGTIADVNAAATNITMDDDYEITANFIAQYDLTIDSTVGGNVTTPGEGLFPDYDAGTVVDLVATPDEGYRFDEWTGDVGTIADVNAAATNITMNGDYSITANFKEVPPSPGGCFIATAAYGSPMAEEIEILREFRDEYLLTNSVGKALVEFYYSVSPPIAEFITEHPAMKPVVKAGLVPAVVMSTVAVNTTPAEKMAIAGLLVLVSVTLAVWATRRRRRDPESC